MQQSTKSLAKIGTPKQDKEEVEKVSKIISFINPIFFI